MLDWIYIWKENISDGITSTQVHKDSLPAESGQSSFWYTQHFCLFSNFSFIGIDCSQWKMWTLMSRPKPDYYATVPMLYICVAMFWILVVMHSCCIYMYAYKATPNKFFLFPVHHLHPQAGVSVAPLFGF